MKFFDLFAGIGGFRVGMERNGHECVGSCEIDKYARQIYAKNFGHEPEYRDVTKLDPKSIKDFDCLCAGFPCQAFSLAGQRRGFEDTRGTLFFEIARIAREKQPSLLFLENVKGLLSHDKGETFRVILETLDELGYWYEWRVVNSKNHGVPQNRERVFIIGHFRGQSTREVLSFGEDGEGNDSSRRTLHPKDECSSTLTSTYWKGYGGGRPMIAESKIKMLKNSNDDSYRIYSTDGIARTLRASPGGMGKMTGVYGEKKTTMIMNANKNSNCKNRIQERDESWALTGNSNDFNVVEGGIPKKKVRTHNPTVEQIQPYLREWREKANISITKIEEIFGTQAPHHWFEKVKFASLPDIDDWLKLKEILEFDDKHDKIMTEHRLMTEFEMMLEHKQRHKDKGNGFGVVIKTPDLVADTLTTWTDRTQVLWSDYRIRKLTPTECERLQGFPDGWTNGCSDTQRYKMLGNAVTTNVVEYIGGFL